MQGLKSVAEISPKKVHFQFSNHSTQSTTARPMAHVVPQLSRAFKECICDQIDGPLARAGASSELHVLCVHLFDEHAPR